MKRRAGLFILILGLGCTTRLPDSAPPGHSPVDGGVVANMPDAGETLLSACLRWITAKCQYEEDCGGRSVDHCVDHAYVRCTNIVAAVNAGRVHMNVAMLPACIAAIGQEKCWGDYEDFLFGFDQPTECQGLFTGSSGVGCGSDGVDTCESGTFCSGATCPALCRSFTEDRYSCHPEYGDFCKPGSYCDHDGYCTPLGQEYYPCRTAGYDCAKGFACIPYSDSSGGECTARAGLNEPCGAHVAACVRGLTCLGADGGHCGPFRQRGETCEAHECVGNDWCDETGHCHAPLEAGESCDTPDGGEAPSCKSERCVDGLCQQFCTSSTECGGQICSGGYCVNGGRCR